MKLQTYPTWIPSIPTNASTRNDVDVNRTLKSPRLSLLAIPFPECQSKLPKTQILLSLSNFINQVQQESSLHSYLFWSIQLAMDHEALLYKNKNKLIRSYLNEDPFKLHKSTTFESKKRVQIPECIGWITLSLNGHLTLFIHSNFTGEGFATEALKSVLNFAFMYFKYDSISLLIHGDPALERVGEKMGMKRVNVQCMSITNDEFRDLWVSQEEE